MTRWLGEGLTSVVCLAEREDSRGYTSQTVALKILKSETRIQWLRREFEVLRLVDSAHCVRLLGWDNIPGQGPALVMDAITGATLEDLGRNNPFTVGEADEVAAQIQAGLADLRAVDRCHGDLSPRNVLVDEGGRLRLIDFGGPPPDAGTAATPAYAAPEIWTGGAPSGSADFFSLGLLHRDLIDGFRGASLLKNGEQAQDRARRAAAAACPWLNPDPAFRRARDLTRSTSEQSNLAARVAVALIERQASAPLKTRTLFEPAVPWAVPFAGRVAGWTLAASIAAFSVVLKPTCVASDLVRSRRGHAVNLGSLDVRTSMWKRLWLNGSCIGFAPARIPGLSAGPHRLAWEGPDGAGELRFVLADGQARRLRDFDFGR